MNIVGAKLSTSVADTFSLHRHDTQPTIPYNLLQIELIPWKKNDFPQNCANEVPIDSGNNLYIETLKKSTLGI